MIRLCALICGVIAVLLGALWLLQGLGIVQLRPILCFADCAPVQGPSPTWTAIGAAVLVIGGCAIVWSRSQASP